VVCVQSAERQIAQRLNNLMIVVEYVNGWTKLSGTNEAYLQAGYYDNREEGNRILDAMIKADMEE